MKDNHQRVCPHLCASPLFSQTLFPPSVSLLQPLNSSSSFNPVLNKCLHFKFLENYFMQPLVPFSHLYLCPQLFSTGEAWEGKASTHHFPLCRPFSSPKGILTTTQIKLVWDTRLTTLSRTDQKPENKAGTKGYCAEHDSHLSLLSIPFTLKVNPLAGVFILKKADTVHKTL